MKVHYKIIFLALIFLLVCLHRYLFASSEGFYASDDQVNYEALRTRLQRDMADYCKLSTFVRNQANTMNASIPGGSADNTDTLYNTVYTCTDILASSRPSCLIPNRTGMRYVSCDVYMKLPPWSPTATDALSLITNDLPERIRRETEWFAAVIKKLQDGLAAGANPQAGSNPVGVPPTVGQINELKEGFQTCSPEAAALLRAKQASDSCTLASPSSEIARVNALLDNPGLKSAISKSSGMMGAMTKLQSDLDKLKNDDLYEWQRGPPKKSYAQFQGGDRIQAFLFSLKQNQ